MRVALVLLAGLAACRPAPAEMRAAPTDAVCLVQVPTERVRDTITVALATGEEADRFVARHRNPAVDGCGVDAGVFLPLPDDSRTMVPPAGRPVIRLLVAGPTDSRDLMDAGVDLVVTADPAALEYARRRGDRMTVPLAWGDTWLLVTPPGAEPIAVPDGAERAGMARDAIRVEARVAEPPWWWDGEPSCFVQGRPPAMRLPDVAIPEGDMIARDLAARLLVIAASPGQTRRLVELDGPAFDAALRTGTYAASVVRFPRTWSSDCRDVPTVPAGARLQPLVDTRAHAIVRPGIPPFLRLPDGTVRLLPAAP